MAAILFFLAPFRRKLQIPADDVHVDHVVVEVVGVVVVDAVVVVGVVVGVGVADTLEIIFE